jgi:hypothetical protein
MRDEFPPTVKELLARRTGYRCSNPDCRQTTCGPQDDPQGAINVGVAAHITAASRGGCRFDDKLTPEERKNSLNGIWLCQNCAKLVDNDANRYTGEKLIEWKTRAEELAIHEIEAGASRDSFASGQAGLNNDLREQVDAVAEAFLADIWRERPTSPDERNYTRLRPAIDGTLSRLDNLRWKHEAFLALPKTARQEVESLIGELKNLQSRSGTSVWYAAFGVHARLRKFANDAR